MARILIVGLNPAWQKVLEFDVLQPGGVNRAQSRLEFGSGKGLNAALMLSQFGHEVLLLQIAGGETGRRFIEFAQEQEIQVLSVDVEAETRVCTTLIETQSGKVTELIEPFEVRPEEEVPARLLKKLELVPGPVDALLLCGTVPGGMSPRIYLELLRATQPQLSILDSYKDIEAEVLKEVSVLKINAQEYQALCQREGINGRIDQFIRTVLITDGPRPARLIGFDKEPWQELEFVLPLLNGIKNPIGAGDAVTAAFAHFRLQQLSPAEAFREALAVGSASCLSLLPGIFQEDDRERIYEEIEIFPHPPQG